MHTSCSSTFVKRRFALKQPKRKTSEVARTVECTIEGCHGVRPAGWTVVVSLSCHPTTSARENCQPAEAAPWPWQTMPARRVNICTAKTLPRSLSILLFQATLRYPQPPGFSKFSRTQGSKSEHTARSCNLDHPCTLRTKKQTAVALF